MEITEVRIKLMEDPHDRLKAFCSITLDGMFVIRDLKIIQGAKGPFVAMPSRKLTDRCPRCYSKNHLRSQFCNQCGVKLDEDRASKDTDGRAKLYADIAHPINSECRENVQDVVLQNFEQELTRSQNPNYVCSYDDYGEENFATLAEMEEIAKAETPAAAKSEEEVATISFSQNDKVHRIDPPTVKAEQPPHQPAADENKFKVTAESTDEQKDEFGSGLV